MNRIVVGVNDSRSSRDALSWAYGAAVREGACLEIVTAFRPSVVAAPPDGFLVLDDLYAREAARLCQLDALTALLDGASAETAIECVVLVGDPVAVLPERAERASLLVVGRGTRRGVRRLWPATSTRCADRATCPVVIVREPRKATAHEYRVAMRRLERVVRSGR
jgi:nucleotide-binding universal stress UspA family protein